MGKLRGAFRRGVAILQRNWLSHPTLTNTLFTGSRPGLVLYGTGRSQLMHDVFDWSILSGHVLDLSLPFDIAKSVLKICDGETDNGGHLAVCDHILSS